MKEEWKVYIKGVPNRGDDVIKELTNLGANNRVSYTGANPQCLYYIDHKGFVDYALLNNENGKIIMDNYSELHLTELWNNGDVLVSNNDTNRFYVFNCFAKDGSIFVCLEINRSPIEDKAYQINVMYHSIFYTPSHKADDKELKTFYNILAERNSTWDAYNNLLLRGNYTYFYPKNGHYYYRRNTLRCKDRTTGEWYDAVLYSDANGQYVREVNDFNNKFKKVEI